MRSKHKELYVAALIQWILRLCRGKDMPVIVDAARAFLDACDSFQRKVDEDHFESHPLPHTLSRGDAEAVIRDFHDLLVARSAPHGIGPIIKVSRKIVFPGTNKETLHRKMANIDSHRTPQWWTENVSPVRGYPAVGWAIFGQDCKAVDHPMLKSKYERDMRPFLTGMKNMLKRVDTARSNGRLTDDTVKQLTTRI